MPKQSNISEALSHQSKYCYSNSDVLINSQGIKDQETLDIVERRISALMLLDLQTKKTPKAFELFRIDYLLKIHEHVFGHLYSFAGKIRTENIVKGNTPFCRPEYIASYLRMTIDKMKDDVKKLKTKEDVVHFLAYYYSELNIIHPFREGNGRVLREYLRQVVNFISLNNSLDYELDFSSIDEEDKKNLLNGSIVSAATGELEYLYLFFDSTLKEKVVNQSFKR